MAYLYIHLCLGDAKINLGSISFKVHFVVSLEQFQKYRIFKSLSPILFAREYFLESGIIEEYLFGSLLIVEIFEFVCIENILKILVVLVQCSFPYFDIEGF